MTSHVAEPQEYSEPPSGAVHSVATRTEVVLFAVTGSWMHRTVAAVQVEKAVWVEVDLEVEFGIEEMIGQVYLGTHLD